MAANDEATPPISFHEIEYPLNAYKTRATGKAGYCFFKGKIFPTSLEKRKYFDLFWLGAMEVPIEGISFIHYYKSYIEILAP
jgi:hypothetical protein